MRLTTKSEYSLLALIYIARHEKKGFVKIENICAHYGISKKYLEQLLLLLRQNRIVRTRRGASGGYALSIPAEKINVAQIIRLMDGALAPTESVSKYYFSHTPLEREAKMIAILRDIRNYIANKLENLTLADVI